jgi:hypothetical protein
MPSQINVRADGVYLVLGTGQEIFLGGNARVTSSGAVVVRFPARDVTVITPIDAGHHVDCSDLQIAILAVVRGGVPLATISATRPAVATAVQTFMTNNGLTAGAID